MAIPDYQGLLLPVQEQSALGEANSPPSAAGGYFAVSISSMSFFRSSLTSAFSVVPFE